MKIVHTALHRYEKMFEKEVNLIHQVLDYTPSIIFDLGASVGGFSIELSKKYPNSMVYAFEPVKITYKLLEGNIKKYSNIKIYNIGLSNFNEENVPIGMPKLPSGIPHNYGRATLHAPASSEFGEAGFDGPPIDYVNIVGFSDFCIKNNVVPDTMKLDIEGSEYQVLSDAKNSGILSQVKVIYIEMNLDYHCRESSQLSMELLLEDYDVVGNSAARPGKKPLNYIFKRKEWER